MKATLEFNLPEDQDEFNLATKAADLQSALWQMKQWLRSETKHAPDDMHEEKYNALMLCRDKLNEIVYDNNIDL